MATVPQPIGDPQAWPPVPGGHPLPHELTSTSPQFVTRGAKPPEPKPRILTLHRVNEAPLIAVFDQHGIPRVNEGNDLITFSMPRETPLNFQVPYFCTALMLARGGLLFDGPGFLRDSTTIFTKLLRQASMADDVALIRPLLSTGLGNAEQIRHAASAAAEAQKLNALNLLAGHWMHWDDPVFLAAPQYPTERILRFGNGGPIPARWQTGVPQTIEKAGFDLLNRCIELQQAEAARDQLFQPGQSPLSGQLFVRTLPAGVSPSMIELLRSLGAASIQVTGIQSPAGIRHQIVVYDSTFDRSQLRQRLLQRQRQNAGRRPVPEESALSHAAAWGDAGLFRELWQSAGRPERKRCWAPALKFAASAGSTEIVMDLMREAPQDLTSVSAYLHALQHAANRGHVSVCHSILSELSARPDSQQWIEVYNGLTHVLNEAAHSGYPYCCALLLRHGADVNALNNNSHLNPLRTAAARNDMAICKMLVSAGAHMDWVDQAGNSILTLAAAIGDVGYYKYLQAYGAEQGVPTNHRPPLVLAAANNQVAMLRYLLTGTMDIDEPDVDGCTALMAASAHNALNAVTFLLEHGAIPTKQGADGRSAIDRAIEGGHFPVVKALADAIARSPSARIPLGTLTRAIRAAQPDMVSTLIRIATLNPRLNGSATITNPLLAVPYRAGASDPERALPHHQILSMLLKDRTLPINHTTLDGNDALMLAARNQDAGAVALLIDAGMRIGQTNNLGENALTMAFRNFPVAGGNHDADRVMRNSQILRSLSNALLKESEAYRASLVADLRSLQLDDPVKRDLVLFLTFANGELTVDIDRMASDFSYQNFLPITAGLAHIPGGGGAIRPASFRDLPMTSALARLHTLFASAERISPQLLKTQSSSKVAHRALRCGVYLDIEAESSALDTEIRTYYAQQPIDRRWQDILTQMSSQWLQARFDEAARYQNEDIVTAVTQLFETCIQHTLGETASASLSLALSRFTQTDGKVEAAVHDAGIYAPFAREIDAAWTQACKRMAEAPSVVALTNRTLPTGSPRAEHQATEEDVADELLAAFRNALRERLDTVSADGHLIHRIDAPEPEARLYTQLMSQQLYMLRQFFDPETDDAV